MIKLPIPIPVSQREALEEYTIRLSKRLCILSGLDKCSACEGGFTLPLTDSWKDYITNNPTIDPNNCLEYHNSRELRFVKDNDMLIGFCYRDDIKYWADHEIQDILLILNAYYKISN